jgi:hypothetical protein
MKGCKYIPSLLSVKQNLKLACSRKCPGLKSNALKISNYLKYFYLCIAFSGR